MRRSATCPAGGNFENRRVRAGVLGAFVLAFLALLGLSVGEIQFPRTQPSSALAASGKSESPATIVTRDTIRAIVAADHRDLSKNYWDNFSGALPAFRPFELDQAGFVHGDDARPYSFEAQAPLGFLARAPPHAIV